MSDAPFEVLVEPSRAARFWGNVDQRGSGCWEWTRAKNGSGYGVVRVGRGGMSFTTMAHRVAWMLDRGEAIPHGSVIDHVCSNRTCCRPEHLRAVTQSANVRASAWYRAGTAEIVRTGPKGVRYRGGRPMVHWREYLADGAVRQAGKSFPTAEAAIEAHPEVSALLTRQHMTPNELHLSIPEHPRFTLKLPS